jgi:hypothetical protein
MKTFCLMFLISGLVLCCSSGVSGDELTPAQIAEKTMPAVVLIKSAGDFGEQAGSGFIVDSSGTIITNLHVIKGAKTVGIKLKNGDIYEQVRIRAYDDRKDLAVIQVSGFGLPTIELGDSGLVKAGDRVVLIGNPFGLEGSVSSGIVSGLRNIEAGLTIIQTDAAANPGNSGGPLIDSMGKVIGVLSFKIRGAESLNFVIPINYARGMLATKDSFTLEEFRTKVGKTNDLFTGEQASAFPTRWKSMNTGDKGIIRIDGDNVYFEHIPSVQLKQFILFHAGELKKVGDKYIGEIRLIMKCPYNDFWTGKQINTCTFNSNIEINLLKPTRIEGFTLEQKNPKIDCRKCSLGPGGEMIMKPFTWIPE